MNAFAFPTLTFGQTGISGLNSWVEARLAGSNNPIMVGGLLFLGGLLASLLPCVYPLYPITATIIRNRSQDSPRWVHPSAYFAGLLLVYASFGVIAAISGGAFNAVLRLGVTNICLAIVFALLALSTAGWIHLPLFQGRAVSARPGVAGTAILGGAAGLLSSACVGPVVVSLLLRLASDHGDGLSAINAVNGAGQMAALGAGVGLPLMCIAIFGITLPKSGPWMIAVQYGLAIIIGYFAYGYLDKGLAILDLPESAAPSIALCTMAFVTASCLIQSDEVAFELRLQRAVLGFGILVSGTILFRTLQPSGNSPSGTVGAASTAPSAALEQDGDLVWHLDKAKAYEEAKELGRNVFIDFYGPWCSNCKEFQKLTHRDSELNTALKKATLLKIHDRKPLFQTYKDDPRFPELKIGLPFFVITDSNGNLLYKTNDYLKTDEMLLFLNE